MCVREEVKPSIMKIENCKSYFKWAADERCEVNLGITRLLSAFLCIKSVSVGNACPEERKQFFTPAVNAVCHFSGSGENLVLIPFCHFPVFTPVCYYCPFAKKDDDIILNKYTSSYTSVTRCQTRCRITR